MLRSLDLFSGVGGITLALRGIAHPVAYCDSSPEARRVLEDNMRSGRLPYAPICKDVRSLDQTWLRAHLVGGPVDMIVGGFPCVGFSTMGLRLGFENAGSGLFGEVLRLADVLACPLLLLENVPNLLNVGMEHVAQELVAKRGYELRWCIASAAAVGAPHERRRWFCLAVKPGFEHFWKNGAPYTPFRWAAATMPERAVNPASRATYTSLALMGNSVVPDAVRYAFVWLLMKCRSAHGPASKLSSLSLPPSTHLEPATAPTHRKQKACKNPCMQQTHRPGARIEWPHCGLLRANTMHLTACHCPPTLRQPPNVQLVFDPSVFRPPRPPSPLMRLPALTSPVSTRRWSTPRHGCTHAVNYITARTLRDLPTQVRFERSTPNHLRAGGVNPAFVEWLMGYPADWTRAAKG